jgi:hypothetical protein
LSERLRILGAISGDRAAIVNISESSGLVAVVIAALKPPDAFTRWLVGTPPAASNLFDVEIDPEQQERPQHDGQHGGSDRTETD